MTKTTIVDNTNRPGQPEPGEDEATQSPSIREQAVLNSPKERGAVEEAEEEERDRQTDQ
jgi:hypothetical protein